MTPLEEAVARIIDPDVFVTDEAAMSVETKWRLDVPYRKIRALEKARAILALPEIVKMQEALKPFSALAEELIQYARTSGIPIHSWSKSCSWDDLCRAREAYAALQPLKKEAE